MFEKVDRLHADINRETEQIKKGCERDIRKIDDRLRLMEKKMWTIFGAVSIVTFLVSAPGQQVLKQLTNNQNTSMITTEIIRST